MAASMWSLLVLAMVLAPSLGLAGTPAPDPVTQAMVEEINLARTNPAAYAAFLEEHKRNFQGPLRVWANGRRYRLIEGLPAVDEAIGFLKKTPPVPALAGSRALSLAARDHATDLGTRGKDGHVGSDGSTYLVRVQRYGQPSSVGEAISFGHNTPRGAIIQLIVDDGIRDRAHRLTLFDPIFQVAGAAVAPHTVYEYVCVIDLADRIEEQP
jgi:uncharacterized protein YkwD